MKQDALNLIVGETYCVISTVDSEGKPEAALVGFSINEKFEVMIGTSKKSRKFKNILNNPNVAIVFGPIDMKTVQYEGNARALEGNELSERKVFHFKKNEGARKYESDPEQTYFLVEPRWIRLVESGPSIIGEETRFDK